MRKKFILSVFPLLFLFSCNEERMSRDLVLVSESTHYRYFFHPSDFIQLDTTWMEAHYDWVLQELDLDLDIQMNYHKYLDRAHLKEITQRNTNGFAIVGSLDFHSIWHPEGHENVHTIVLATMGHPPSLFTEGIAVSLAPQPIYGPGVFHPFPTWSGTSLDQIASELKYSNHIPPLDQLIESESFFSFDSQMTYPMAGSFVRYLRQEYPLESLKTFFGSVDFESNKQEVRAAFHESYQTELDQVWDSWLIQL